MTPVLGIVASSNQQGRGGGPVSSYDALATVVVPSGGLSLVVFAGIPVGYRNLEIRAVTLKLNDVFVRFNDDEAANYNRHSLYSNGNGSVTTFGEINSIYNALSYGEGSATNPNAATMTILDYSASNKFKTTRSISGINNNSGTSAIVMLNSGAWRNTTPINKITVIPWGGSFSQNTHIALYGVK
jgi:hypothetical protein